MKIITTSWDDGHPLDFKLAELLAKYNLAATFYIPRTNAEGPVMNEKAIQALAKNFEIGGHGLRHLRLTALQSDLMKEEVKGCYRWLSQLLGDAPVSFCFPGGAYNKLALQTVFKSGFQFARTTALFSTAMLKENSATATTLQLYSHSGITYAKHLSKRFRWTSLWQWINRGREADLYKLTENFLEEITRFDGCFHLWGHSWEIEKYNLWKPVETVFKILANRPGFYYVQNRGLLVSASLKEPSLTIRNT